MIGNNIGICQVQNTNACFKLSDIVENLICFPLNVKWMDFLCPTVIQKIFRFMTGQVEMFNIDFNAQTIAINYSSFQQSVQLKFI